MKLRGRLQNSSWYSRVVVWLMLMMILTLPALVVIAQTMSLSTTESMRWVQFWQTLTVFILPVMITAYMISAKPIEWLHLNRGMSWRTAVVAIAMMIIAVPGINLLSWLNQQFVLPDFLQGLEQWMQQKEKDAELVTEMFLQVDGIGMLLLNLGLMALLPAIGEELTFRGFVQGLFGEKKKTIAIWCTAAIFSFIHLQFYGFVPRMLMGALFGYMLVWTGSLWVPMLMHFTNNAMAVISYYVCYHSGLESSWADEFGAAGTWYVGVVSLTIVIVLAYFFARERSSEPRP